MAKFKLRGTVTALVTPFKRDLSIDFDALKKIIEFQIKNGVESILVGGSTGEAATMSAKERTALIIQTVEFVNGRIPVIAGTGTNNTQQSIDFTLLAKEHGADAALVVAPYYNKPSQTALYNHFLAISENVDIPMIIYNVPSRTSVNINAETQLKIAEDCENVVATKEASGDLEQMMTIMKYAPEGFCLYSGDDAICLPVIQMGGEGVISVMSNYAPKEFGDMVRAMLRGHHKKAVELHYRLFDLMRLNFVETNPSPVKAAMNILGLCDNVLRLPMIPVLRSTKKALEEGMKEAGVKFPVAKRTPAKRAPRKKK